MPWDMKDYPVAMKNFDEPLRKKAIDIGNALLAEGYEEDRAIPIAISQAKKWYDSASKKELTEWKQATPPTKEDTHDTSGNPELINADEKVVPHEEGWAVQSDNAKRAAEVVPTKKEAIKRAKEIAKNKESTVKVYKKDGHFQREIRPKND